MSDHYYPAVTLQSDMQWQINQAFNTALNFQKTPFVREYCEAEKQRVAPSILEAYSSKGLQQDSNAGWLARDIHGYLDRIALISEKMQQAAVVPNQETQTQGDNLRDLLNTLPGFKQDAEQLQQVLHPQATANWTLVKPS